MGNNVMNGDSASFLAPSPTAPGGGDDARVKTLRDGVELLEALAIDDDRLVALRQALDKPPEADELAGLELALLEIDEAIPAPTFRERFRGNLLPPDALCRYAALLARNAASTTRFDRIELIVTRLLTRELADGQLEVLPETDFLSVLEQITPRVVLSAERRDKSITFFLNAAQRLEAFTSIHDVFNSGIYLDVQGYKRALRDERLDPGILYVSVLLSVAITNHLMRFASRAGIERSVVLSRVASTELKVDEIFSASEDLDVARKRPKRAPPKSAAKSTERAERAWEPPAGGSPARASSMGSRAALAFGLLFTLAGGALAWRGPVPRENTLDALPAAKMASISSHLKVAEVSEGRARPLLVGRVDDSSWMLLSLDQRRAVAEEIRQGIAHHGIATAVVYRGKTLVVHVDQGRIVLVQ